MRLGPYEILSPAGSGGMGEVYRGRDTRLDRVVAIKVLSPQVSTTAELAYLSYESGRNEVYVTSFPGRSSKWQVSTNGGREPRWRADGKELFYFTSDNVLTAVEVKTSASGLELGAARPLFTFQLRALRGAFDVSADGRHFLVNTIANEDLPPLMLVTNWTAELKK